MCINHCRSTNHQRTLLPGDAGQTVALTHLLQYWVNRLEIDLDLVENFTEFFRPGSFKPSAPIDSGKNGPNMNSQTLHLILLHISSKSSSLSSSKSENKQIKSYKLSTCLLYCDTAP